MRKEKSTDKVKSGRLVFFIQLGINLLLCAALVVTLCLFDSYKKTPVIEPAVAEPQLPQEEVITMEAFKGYAQQYSVSIEFLQRFFEDEIVYKDETGIVYEPINPDIPKNDYDWNNLVRADGKIEYQEDGVSTGIKGIDVSKFQGDIDWKKVKADGVEYAMIRLGNRGYTEGKLVIDEKYEKNIKGALAADVKVGIYFYSQAVTVEEAVEEAQLVLDNIKGYDITYPIVFDAEEIPHDTARTDNLTKEQITDMTIAFCDTIQEAGYTPMIYGNIKWMIAKLDLSRVTAYDKWFAQYFNTPFFPYEFQMWQYSAKGKVDGIKGDVDLNLGFVDYAAAQTP